MLSKRQKILIALVVSFAELLAATQVEKGADQNFSAQIEAPAPDSTADCQTYEGPVVNLGRDTKLEPLRQSASETVENLTGAEVDQLGEFSDELSSEPAYEYLDDTSRRLNFAMKVQPLASTIHSAKYQHHHGHDSDSLRKFLILHHLKKEKLEHLKREITRALAWGHIWGRISGLHSWKRPLKSLFSELLSNELKRKLYYHYNKQHHVLAAPLKR